MRLLAQGKAAAASIENEATKAEVIAELSAAQARAGDIAGARALAETIAINPVKSRALSIVAGIEVKLGNAAGARTMAQAVLDQLLSEQLLFAVAVAQADSGDAAGASDTVKGLSSPIGKAMAMAVVAELRAKAGDGAGYRQTVQEARELVKGLPTSQESLIAAREIVSVQTRMGDVSGASVTANDWLVRRLSNLFVEIMGAQAEAGDVSGAKRTSEGARFGEEGLIRAWTRVADAQGRAGKFAEAKESLERVPNKDQKLLGLVYLAAQAGDLAGGKATATAIASGGKMDDDRRLLYGRAVAPLVVLQAKEGFPSGEKWIETMDDPIAKALSYTALAGLRYTATAPEYKSLMTQSRNTLPLTPSSVALAPGVARPSAPVVANPVVASPAAKVPAAPSSSSLITSSLPSGGIVKGKFHLYIDDGIHLYLNGVEIFASDVLQTGQTKEVE
ncbi:MAG TPA: hypothetical protein VGO11_20710, partial [Chthoniobacteraceae bacterium]|nr:hypothetical protein [Chthoniobacteraceae bacterium]